MGYKLKKEVDFKDYHPDHAPFMKCDLIFSLYEKKSTMITGTLINVATILIGSFIGVFLKEVCLKT